MVHLILYRVLLIIKVGLIKIDECIWLKEFKFWSQGCHIRLKMWYKCKIHFLKFVILMAVYEKVAKRRGFYDVEW